MNPYIFIIDFLPPLLFLYYGFRLRFQTPPMGDRNAINTKYTKSSEKAWRAGNRFAGLLLLTAGALMLASTAANYLIFGEERNALMLYVTWGVGLVFIALLYPLVNAKLKKQFGVQK